ncbi:Cytochrome c7 c [uncultured archaeon]|nr:Cytochrome c7 c [uncultured archaeon]
MNSKIILLSMAVVSVGLFAMPSTLSLFAGQHNFVAPDNVTCQKCHQDIYDTIQSSDMHNSLGDNGATAWNSGSNDNALGKCVGCHRVSDTFTNVSVPYGSLTGWFNQTPAGLGFGSTHTMVVTLECVQCHTAVPGKFNDPNETHNPYYGQAYSASNSSTIQLKGANAACVGCHTHTVVTLNWTRPTGYNVNITENTTGAFNLNFSMNTTATQTNITSSQ